MKNIGLENEKESQDKGVVELQLKIESLQDQIDKSALKDIQISNMNSSMANLQKVV
jgi:hypothetical protein